MTLLIEGIIKKEWLRRPVYRHFLCLVLYLCSVLLHSFSFCVTKLVTSQLLS